MGDIPTRQRTDAEVTRIASFKMAYNGAGDTEVVGDITQTALPIIIAGGGCGGGGGD
jgi:hypothetical protein